MNDTDDTLKHAKLWNLSLSLPRIWNCDTEFLMNDTIQLSHDKKNTIASWISVHPFGFNSKSVKGKSMVAVYRQN